MTMAPVWTPRAAFTGLDKITSKLSHDSTAESLIMLGLRGIEWVILPLEGLLRVIKT